MGRLRIQEYHSISEVEIVAKRTKRGTRSVLREAPLADTHDPGAQPPPRPPQHAPTTFSLSRSASIAPEFMNDAEEVHFTAEYRTRTRMVRTLFVCCDPIQMRFKETT